MVTGLPGAGKSTVLKHHKMRFPDVRDEDGLRITVVLAEMPSPCTKKGVVEAIFRSMQHDAPREWNSADIIDEIARLVEKHHVAMIMIDEADRMIGKEVASVSKFFVSLLNTVGAQFVLAGAPEILSINTDFGLKRRLGEDIILEPYMWDTKAGQIHFRTILQVFEQRIGTDLTENIHSPEMAKRIYVATGGHIGIVSKLLVAAVTEAVLSGTKISKELLGNVWLSQKRKTISDALVDFDRDVAQHGDAKRRTESNAYNPFLCQISQLKALYEQQLSIARGIAEDVDRAGRDSRALSRRFGG